VPASGQAAPGAWPWRARCLHIGNGDRGETAATIRPEAALGPHTVPTLAITQSVPQRRGFRRGGCGRARPRGYLMVQPVNKGTCPITSSPTAPLGLSALQGNDRALCPSPVCNRPPRTPSSSINPEGSQGWRMHRRLKPTPPALFSIGSAAAADSFDGSPRLRRICWFAFSRGGDETKSHLYSVLLLWEHEPACT
jgi:hypothetical protein